MLITRWQAPLVPEKQQILNMFEAEGLTPQEELLQPQNEVKDHRHPFDEVRMVASGELLMDIAGNKLLLRAGDRIVIPANTKHSKKVNATEPCLCICASKTY